jgi:PAS domain S-box-containing protein
MNIAEQFLLVAVVQSFLLTAFLFQKAALRNVTTLLFAFFMANYSLVLLRAYLGLQDIELTRLHLPIGYAAGPVFYYFVRFSFLPTQNMKSQRWLLWFIPLVIELSLAGVYWVLYGLGSEWAAPFGRFTILYIRPSFFYFLGFLIASIVFLAQHNATITMNLLYKRQLKWLKMLFFFIFLFILDEFFGKADDILFYSVLACVFTSSFVYFLWNTANAFSPENQAANEVLKAALNEREKAVVITNRDRIIEYVNQAFLDIIGYKHRDVIGRKPSFLQGDLTTSESVSFMTTHLAAEMPFEVNVVNYRKSGEAYICNIHFTPVFSDGQLTHFVAYEQDIETIASAAPNKDELVLLQKIKDYCTVKKPCQNRQLQVADFAEATGISARRIGELLKKYENQSFVEFINAARIDSVIAMLKDEQNSNITIDAISQMCGFNSKSVFHAAFKKKTGTTPKAFLDNNLN